MQTFSKTKKLIIKNTHYKKLYKEKGNSLQSNQKQMKTYKNLTNHKTYTNTQICNILTKTYIETGKGKIKKE